MATDWMDIVLLLLQMIIVGGACAVMMSCAKALHPARKHKFETTVQALYATFMCTASLCVICGIVTVLLASDGWVVDEIKRDHADWYHAALTFGLVCSGQALVKLYAMYKWVETARARGQEAECDTCEVPSSSPSPL